MIRDFVHTVKLDGALVPLAEPVRIQEALEGAVTSVAEIVLSGAAAGPLSTNTALTIDHVNRGQPTSDNRYTSRRQFAGIVNQIDSDGVTLTCTGPLAKLRRTRTDDLNLSGLTDITATRAILSFCGISYTASDISGWGYVLGQVSPIIWSAGQSGAAMLGELDRVFHCATIEVGDGRIVRFPYHLSPYQYTSPTYAKTFTRGQKGVSFYDDQRIRGDIDQIQNYWQVTGINYQGAEGTETEGCSFQVYAVGQADHPQLGPGIFTGPQTFSSDLIQSEDLAKAISTWLLQAYNREPDALTIRCGNDALIGPGDLVLVKDPSYGIDLASQKRYLVRAITRDGDTMTLECIGGPTGIVGTVHSGILRQCNDTSAEVGTDGPAFAAPAFSIPPDPSADFVDPALDPIVPDGGDVPEPPNVTDLLTGCTAGETGFGQDADPDLTLPWRLTGQWGLNLHDMTGYLESMDLFAASGSLTYNTTEPETGAKAIANDELFDKNANLSLALRVTLHYPKSSIQVRLVGVGEDLTTTDATATVFSEGWGVYAPITTVTYSFPGGTYGVQAKTENAAVGYPGVDPLLFGGGDKGSLAGSPVTAGEAVDLAVAFQVSEEYQATQVQAGSAGSTTARDPQQVYKNDFKELGVVDKHFGDCQHTAHKLLISITTDSSQFQSNGGDQPDIDLDHPLATISITGLGSGCTPNPDYALPPLAPEAT